MLSTVVTHDQLRAFVPHKFTNVPCITVALILVEV